MERLLSDSMQPGRPVATSSAMTQKRVDMFFGDDDDVCFPERSGVMVGEDVVSLEDLLDRRLAGEYFVAVEI